MPQRGTAEQLENCPDVAFPSIFATDGYSGKLYALGKRPGAWQTDAGGKRAARMPPDCISAAGPSHGALCTPAGALRKAPMANDVQSRSPLQGIKVMVIDDSNTIRRSAEIFLLQAGCTVILAEDGFDALAKIADHQPDMVFVDIMMPRLDGYQTCALIKKNSRFHAMPVVMLSSKDGLFDRARGRMVGSDQYLTKPFTKESLLKAVGAHVRTAAASA
jgi:twitching motility two-component system response regulator PilG